jgi:hypothetical protein
MRSPYLVLGLAPMAPISNSFNELRDDLWDILEFVDLLSSNSIINFIRRAGLDHDGYGTFMAASRKGKQVHRAGFNNVRIS